MIEFAEQLRNFATGPTFWPYHGWGLTIAWLLFSFLGILCKRLVKTSFGLYSHALIFFITDLTTWFLIGTAAFRVYPKAGNFFEWSLLKQLHVVFGLIFSLLLILQHIGGVRSFYGADGRPHKSFGYILATSFKFVAIVGWVLKKHNDIAIYCGVVTVIEFLAMALLKKLKLEEKK